MRNTLLIAKREYLEQIRGRAFRLSTIGVPLLFAVILGIVYLASQGMGSNRHYVVASPSAALANAVRAQMLEEKKSNTRVDVVDSSEPGARDSVLAQVKSRSVDGALFLTPQQNPQQDALPAAEYYSYSSGDFITSAKLTIALDNGLVAQDLTARGMQQSSADAVIKGVTIGTFQVRKDGSIVKSNAQAAFWKGYGMALLLSIATIIYGMNVARSIIQEKTSRIFEVMLATVDATDLLAGKLIGVGSVGLTQILIWLVAAFALMATPLAAAVLTGQYSIHFSWVEVVLFPVYFVLGFLLYSSLFAGLAATCESEQELQQYAPLAAVPVWLSFSMITFIMSNPNSFWSVAVSLFPPCAPIARTYRRRWSAPRSSRLWCDKYRPAPNKSPHFRAPRASHPPRSAPRGTPA